MKTEKEPAIGIHDGQKAHCKRLNPDNEIRLDYPP